MLIDAGFLIALVNERDELHARAVAWTATLDEPLVLTDYVLVEAVNYFSASAQGRRRVHEVLAASARQFDLIDVHTTPELLRRGLALHRDRPDQTWSLTDCVSFVVMRDRDIAKALTHDHHFEQAGFEALLRREP